MTPGTRVRVNVTGDDIVNGIAATVDGLEGTVTDTAPAGASYALLYGGYVAIEMDTNYLTPSERQASVDRGTQNVEGPDLFYAEERQLTVLEA